MDSKEISNPVGRTWNIVLMLAIVLPVLLVGLDKWQSSKVSISEVTSVSQSDRQGELTRPLALKLINEPLGGKRAYKPEHLIKRTNMSQGISPYCIYTIRHTDILDKCFKDGGNGEFTEDTKWVTGRRLFLDAERDEMKIPVIFAAADVGSGLLYYAWLKDVKVSDEDSTTTYKFTGLKRITNEPPKSSLKLMNTNRPLSNDFIRPYALCYTPSFIKGQRNE